MSEQKRKVMVIVSREGYILLLISITFLALGITTNSMTMIIPSLLLPLIFINFIALKLRNGNQEIILKFQTPSVEIKAKQFLHVSVTVSMESTSMGLLSLEVSDGLFPVVTSQNSIFVVDRASTFLFYAPRRGLETITSVVIRFNGILSLFHLETRIIIQKDIIVVPEPQRVTLPWKMKQKILEQLVAEISIPIKGRGYDFLSLRDYQFGDDVRHIHWKATAKHSKLIVKEFEEQMMLRFLIVVDSSLYMAGPKLEFALSSAVEIATVIHRSTHSLSVICQGDRYSKLFHLGNSTPSLRTLAMNLHSIRAEGSQFNYTRLQQFIRDHKLQGSVLILLTDLEMDPNRVGSGISGLSAYMQHIFVLACNSPGFGTLALAHVQDLRMYDVDEVNYRRIVVEPSLERIYGRREMKYKSNIEGPNSSFHVIDGYNTNVLLELQRMLRKRTREIRGVA